MTVARPSLADIPCDFPFVLPSCTTPFSDVLGTRYTLWRVIYMLTGLLGVTLTVPRLWIVYKRGSDTQKAVFPFLFIVALTFVIRGVDPNSYQNMLPNVLSDISWAVSTAGLYSCCYTIVMVWGALIQSFGTGSRRIPLGIRIAGLFLIAATWTVLGVSSFVFGQEPRQKFSILTYVRVEYIVLVALDIIAVIYFLYAGITLNKRLSESVNKMDTRESTPAKVLSSGAIELGSIERQQKKGDQDESNDEARSLGPLSLIRRWKNASKIQKMLVSLTAATIASIFFQSLTIYQAFSGNEDVYAWQTYNLCLMMQAKPGVKCSPSFDNEVFGILQLVILLLLTWAFWKLPAAEAADKGLLVTRERQQDAPSTSTLDDYGSQAILSSTYSASSSMAGDFIPREMRITADSIRIVDDVTPRVPYSQELGYSYDYGKSSSHF